MRAPVRSGRRGTVGEAGVQRLNGAAAAAVVASMLLMVIVGGGWKGKPKDKECCSPGRPQSPFSYQQFLNSAQLLLINGLIIYGGARVNSVGESSILDLYTPNSIHTYLLFGKDPILCCFPQLKIIYFTVFF